MISENLGASEFLRFFRPPSLLGPLTIFPFEFSFLVGVRVAASTAHDRRRFFLVGKVTVAPFFNQMRSLARVLVRALTACASSAPRRLERFQQCLDNFCLVMLPTGTSSFFEIEAKAEEVFVFWVNL